MNKNLLLLFLAASFTFNARADEPLFNQLPLPGGTSLGGEATIFPHSDTAQWSPGFRTASSATHSYVTGWTARTEIVYLGFASYPVTRYDGFITKLDPKGGIEWTEYMRDLTGVTSNGWMINDIAVGADGKIFVCGSRDELVGLNTKTEKDAFVALLTDNGATVVCTDYTIIEGVAGGLVAGDSARASSITLATVSDELQITVAGDVLGNTMRVLPKQKTTNSAATFNNLVLRCNRGHDDDNDSDDPDTDDYVDAWVLRLNDELVPQWGTTLGFKWSHDYPSAVAADNTGKIYLAMKFENADRNGGARIEQIDNIRKVVTSGNSTGSIIPQGGNYIDIDFYPGSWSILLRLDPDYSTSSSTSLVSTSFVPILYEGGEVGSHDRIADIEYSGGKLYLLGEWKKWLRPYTFHQNGAPRFDGKKTAGNADTYDVYVARLNEADLVHEQWRLYQSNADDFANELTISGSDIYVTGSAGGTLTTNTLQTNMTGGTEQNISPESSATHLFWDKLSLSTFTPTWHEIPVETSGISIPSVQRSGGIAVLGDDIVITGGWDGGSLSMGTVSEYKTLLDPPAPAGFVGFLDSDKIWKRGITVTIRSDFGSPDPPRGLKTLVAGGVVDASVDAEVYEDATGNIVSPEDPGAVTRRICTGYQFQSSEVNGTSNSVSFVANEDKVLTFNWRTEYAVEIDSDLAGSDGLTSPAAGNPQPAVGKHWIREDEPFTAFIDGSETDAAEPGTRWRSLGYIVEGSATQVAGLVSGDWVRWGDLQNRQQTPEIIVNGPAKITWQWQKEHSVRQSVNSSVAIDKPTLVWEQALPGFVSRIGEFFEVVSPVTVDTLNITFDSTPPPFIRIYAGNGPGDWQSQTVPVSAVQGESTTLRFPPLAARIFRITGADAAVGGNLVANGATEWGLWRGGEKSGSGEFWVPAGFDVTLESQASVDSGFSVLDLKGYNTGQGNVTPPAASGVTSKTITVNQPSAITWDYARAIYDETVELGDFLTFSGVDPLIVGRINQSLAPLAGNVSSGPTGSSFGDMQIWDQVENRLLALQPGTFTAEFQNTMAPEDPAQNIIVQLTVEWPSEVDYTHVIETPPVDLDPSATDGTSFIRIAHTESLASMGGGGFSAVEPGRSVLLFSQRAGGGASGDFERESVSVKVVDSINWQESAGSSLIPATIGEHLTSGDHDANEVGHNGHVIQKRAPVNANVYDPATNVGPIIPVNAASTDGVGMIAHFPLAEGAGTVTVDEISGTEATLTSGTLWASPGVDFRPNLFERVESDPGVGNGITTQLTLAAWIEPDTFPNWGGIITKGVTQSPYSMTVSSSGNLRFLANSFAPAGGVGDGSWDSNGTLSANTFHHVAVTYDGTNLRFFIDGVLDTTVAASFTMGSVNEPLVIGADLPGGQEFFDGVIRDVRVYDRALGESEMAALHGGQVEPEKAMAVAWYRVEDSIRWPYLARSYRTQWPFAPPRIVVAGRFGSEGVSSFTLDPAGGFPAVNSYGSFVLEPVPTWRRPNDDLATVADPYTKFNRVGIAPLVNGDPMYVYTWGWSGKVFLYQGTFDPDKPLENLQSVSTTEADTWLSLGGGLAFTEYNIVFAQESPESGFGWVSAELNGGAGVYSYQEAFRSPKFSDPQIYNQPNPAILGYNPNEEHALIAPSFDDPTRPAAFALHNDLNRTDPNAELTSLPYTLVQYEDRSDPANPIARMRVYSVVEEDASTYDLRLPLANRAYTYNYLAEAGTLLDPPYPLSTVIGASPVPAETNGLNVDGRISYYEDKNGVPWVVSGDPDVGADIEAAWYYPMRSDFWHPTAQVGEAIPLGALSGARPRNISYHTFWPADVAVLKAGETLTFSGGEYASDNNSATPQPQGLPTAAAWQAGKLVFDETNVALTPGDLDSSYLARVTPALESREVPFALTAVPASLQPAAGKVIVDGTLWRFKDLPASLQERVYYDTISQELGVRGLLNGRILGDGDLLAAPGAQTILQPNVLTAEDEALVTALAADGNWTFAVSVLAALSRDPEQGGGIGLEPALGGAKPANSFGPGLAVVTNPALLQAGATGGYITVAENDHPDSPDTPVAMHVIRIDTEKYRGSVAVMKPSNVFDEKVTLRHTADFGGEVADLFFEWVIREEDGNPLDPPPTGGWTPFTSGLGKVDAQLAGTGATLITDNLVFCRYRHKDDATGWSDWAGAANSYPPNDYVAQLAPGWVKRVAAGVNLFDARYSDFRSNDAPATYTSALQQAGQRWEGPVAFNPDKDAVENVGLIELYQSVLDRAEAFTIDTAVGTDGVNTALLNAANRIASLYTLMGNEAYADALDPTVGFSTVSGQFGNLAPTLHAFQNQTANLLDEELTLLRGRDEPGARPAYNRLPWNFTNGSGEAAYVLNYGIEDLTEDGFLDDEDARRLYPQGHGDAWGHYTMALRGYYDLATTTNFTWSPRAEKYNIDGVVLDIDYMDERAFAKTAAAKAQCGAELVDLTYRQAYTENPDGQWQGYQDVDTDRAWGVFETAQRAGTGAFFDWMLGNALLPADDTTNTGIQKVDRSTVGELSTIAAHAANIQTKLDAADRGLNPAGLDPNVVPFDIDPALVDRNHQTPATHFEQILSRAKGAASNTLRIFDHANEAATLLRQTEASSEKIRQQTIDQDRSYRNRLIELFGTPYDGMIGSGKAYPAGYSGPDLYLYAYMDRLSVGDDILNPAPSEIVRTQVVPGLRNLSSDTNPFSDDDQSLDAALSETVSNYFPGDLTLPTAASGIIDLDLPRAASSYALTAPEGWGQRSSPGAIQAAIQELIQADWELRAAVLYYTETADDFKALLRRFEIKSGIASNKIALMQTTVGQVGTKLTSAADYFTSYTTIDAARNLANNLAGAISEGIPETVGLSNDAGSPAVGITLSAGAIADAALQAAMTPLQVLEYRANLDASLIQLEMDEAQLTEDLRSELVDMLDEIVQFVNGETDKQIPIITALEQMRAASDRVRTVIQEGQSLIEERTVFNQRVAATTTKQRYEDYTFRVFHNEALRKYRSSFDLATRYAYLAGKAYQYELNLPDNHAANASPLLAGMLRERALGEWQDGEPVLGGGGLAEHLAVLETNFETLKGQLGFNNPEAETNVMSLRRELAQIGLSSRVNGDWRTQLESWRVPDLWNYEFQSNGVNYGYIFRRYCRPFAAESAGAQPALVIPFSSSVKAGENWFGNPIAGGDSAFNPSNFSTKVRAAGVRFDAYNNIALSQTPQAYLVPVGNDVMFLPDSPSLQQRSWQVADQRIPAPIGISASNLADPDWQPFTGSANGYFEDIRKFSSFRAYHDAGGWDLSEMVNSGRLVGRSVWNTQWVLIIPSASLLYDGANPSAGIDTLIHGAPLPGFDQTTAGTTNRDEVGVRDIRILLQTYSASGN